MQKLKPCPFCGKKPKSKIELVGAGFRRRFVICGCEVMQYRSIPYKYWNTRKGDSNENK